MKTLAVISRKGGAGKTTLALNLAAAAERLNVPTVVIDLDPQASAKTWHDIRASKEAPFVVSAQASRLDEVLEVSRANGSRHHRHGPAFRISGARGGEGGGSGADSALAKKEAVVVLNAVPHQGRLGDEAEEAVRSYGLVMAPVKLTQPAALVHSLTAGQTAQEFEPEGKAAEEIEKLYKWTRTRIHAFSLETVRKSA